MYFKICTTASLAALIGFAPAPPVQADAGDALAGALVGGFIGHAIANDQNRRRQQQTTVRRSSSRSTMSTAQREANKEVQTSLNYFGYPVGAVDGALGSRSRAAISQYQVLIGYPPTGQLTDYERTILTAAYHRAVAGGPMVAQTVSTHPQGMRGLLLIQRDEMAGIPTQPPAMMTAAPFAPAPAPAMPAAALPLLAAEPEPVPAPAPALPSFLGNGAMMVSLASKCNTVGLTTNSNGGYTTVAAMTDPGFALAEQFCLARSSAIAAGEQMSAQVAGFTPQQISEQCGAFGPVLKDHVAALSLKPRDEVLQGVSGFVQSSGMAPAQLTGTAKICLGVGYASDSMDVAIGSALMLTALGQKGYAELLGHHLSQGFGAATRPDLALDWYEMGLSASQAGGTVFAPNMPDRSEVIRKAAYTMGGRVDLLPEAPATLPVFTPAELQQEAAAPAAPEAPAPAAPMMALAQSTSQALPIDGAKAVSMAARLPFLLMGQ
ncbi:peptidoglycan-binding protein [Cereibacter changlensis JA139]|uniref:Peptidoglycan-binding protein n=2 Tax=Cereibacter changlensis TaxID=402884 RepID=A0A2T4JSJ1_9RHOB|nr:peptidoglycan-binding domain-containing protein [Cereibacter changlensis]PTE20878.1 peptidoglycan-binding protein [Cereibacter changlensis JA139]PZX53597.1 putative peptidoglycan binding protein [Cereibacter changlensis]